MLSGPLSRVVIMTAAFVPPQMNLLAYWHSIGTRNFDQMCGLTTLSGEYLRLVAYGYKRLSPRAAKEVLQAAAQVTPGWLPEYELLIRRSRHRGSRRNERGLIPASRDFILWSALNEGAKRDKVHA